jgi:hypothetical protein
LAATAYSDILEPSDYTYVNITNGTYWLAVRDKANTGNKTAKSVTVDCPEVTTTTTTTTAAPTTTTTTTTATPRYRYLRYTYNTETCLTSGDGTEVWSYQNVSNGFYTIADSGNYYLSTSTHSNDTTEIFIGSNIGCTTTTTTAAPETTTTTTAAPTTTTTTTAGPTYYYNNAYRNTCGGENPCTDDGVVVVLRSTQPLSNLSWYSNGTKSYQPYETASGPSYGLDIDIYFGTEAASCEEACNNYYL